MHLRNHIWIDQNCIFPLEGEKLEVSIHVLMLLPVFMNGRQPGGVLRVPWWLRNVFWLKMANLTRSFNSAPSQSLIKMTIKGFFKRLKPTWTKRTDDNTALEAGKQSSVKVTWKSSVPWFEFRTRWGFHCDSLFKRGGNAYNGVGKRDVERKAPIMGRFPSRLPLWTTEDKPSQERVWEDLHWRVEENSEEICRKQEL